METRGDPWKITGRMGANTHDSIYIYNISFVQASAALRSGWLSGARQLKLTRRAVMHATGNNDEAARATSSNVRARRGAGNKALLRQATKHGAGHNARREGALCCATPSSWQVRISVSSFVAKSVESFD